MNAPTYSRPLELKYHRITAKGKRELLKKLESRLKNLEEVSFAFIHGGFQKSASFRDLDVAIWIKNPGKAFQYTVNLSAEISSELGMPVDIHVLNEAPLPLKFHVFSQGKLVFSKDEQLRTRLTDEVIRQYLDFKFLTHS